MNRPLVSVVMPVHNGEKYIRKSLDCVANQTIKDIEVICVDDFSSDKSVDVLKEYSKSDDRFQILPQNENRGAGAARNVGITHANGKYVIFLDSDDLFEPDLLEKTVKKAEITNAQIVAFNFTRFDDSGNQKRIKGIHNEWLPAGTDVFSYKECPNQIMSIILPVPWNKLYRLDFVKEKNLKFEEISSTNDITFASVSAASAERISYIQDALVHYRVSHSGTITSSKGKKLYNVQTAVTSAVNQVQALPYYTEIKNAAARFAVDNFVFSLNKYVADISSEIGKNYYSFIHEYFRRSLFDELTADILNNDLLYAYFCCIRDTEYQDYVDRSSRKVTVSLTSFPARINYIPQIVENLLRQSKKPDKIELWLAETQFKNHALPDKLVQEEKQGNIIIRWCDDLGPHKKYFYALQEQQQDEVVITVDDDIVYPNNLIEILFQSYIHYPDAISAARTHLMLVDDKKILPYHYWIKETRALIGYPSMQLLATGGAGCLYPPNTFPKELFEKEIIVNTCPHADDLWMKAMEIIVEIPVVVAFTYMLHYISGSQEETLFSQNKNGGNDEQLEKIINYVDSKYGEGFFVTRLTESKKGIAQTSITAIMNHVDYRLRNNQKAVFLKAENKKLKKKIRKIYSSPSYRIGHAITWLPRKLKSGLRYYRKHGFRKTVYHYVHRS